MKKGFEYLIKLLPIIAIIYMIYKIIQLDVDFSLLFSTPNTYLYIILVIIFYLLSIFITAFNYQYSLENISSKSINHWEIMKVYITANLFKYFPGNVMHYVGRNVLGKKYDIDHSDLIFSTIFEIFINVLIIGLLSILFGFNYLFDLLIFLKDSYPQLMTFIVILIIIGLIILILLIIKMQRIRYYFQRIFSKNMIRLWLVSSIIFTINYFINGVSFYLLLSNFFSEGINHQFLLIIISYNLAWLVGFITPGAPGGIGIKEIVLLFFLGGLLNREIILFVLVVHRLILIFVDILAYLILKLSVRR